ncbi:hypothetical protein QRK99_001128 [Escherichia coli]|nr:hypothetical protein [Escherichia coli]
MESNIKGLAAAGHEMASELKAECGAVDMRSVAKLLSDLATQLEVQLVRANALAEDQQRAIESIKQADSAVKLAHEKFSALAAENAGLKSGAMDEIKVINRGGQAYCVKDGVQVNPMYARGWNDYRAKSMQSDTPATDAFLADVRAQGVEMAVDVVKQCYDNICAGGLQENREYEESIVQPYLDGIDDELKEIIAQLRKGVQS